MNCSSFITTAVQEQRPRSYHKGATYRIQIYYDIWDQLEVNFLSNHDMVW